jgi:hypothetical protein
VTLAICGDDGPEVCIFRRRQTLMATEKEQSAAEKVVGNINEVTQAIGTLVPTIGAIGSMVRLIATAVRPTDAQKAQAFDAAIAEFDAASAGLASAVAGFDQAKASVEAKKTGEGNAVGAMMAKTSGAKSPSDG